MTIDNSTPTRFESERLILRPYQAGDGAMYYAVGQKNRQHLQRYEADNVILTAKNEQEAETLVQELAANWAARKCFFLGAWDRISSEFVAQVYIGVVNWDTPEFEIGYFVDLDHEGQGYVTEAVSATLDFVFEHLQAQRASLRCNATNLRSQRVAERCGFTREGCLRQNRRQPDGSFSDSLIYGLLRNEWGEAPKTPPRPG
ncbi:MAG: GNAT family N-acetyltransferase [Anaerolineales bacterium]|jgi:RimJ/RimL family protein N-acetyltransferase|nr:GNAT family N-acetyltransferase [Anaerolineales bacterium]